ncbi:MAG TPA: L-threonylcarbamoyladenylate synthase [Gaiellaceae bacterium]|nr:L-threonylcarbamoyladenylate synthase [Gaiellaceae bacterium]
MNAEDALRAGLLAVLPTDTVYGVCASPFTWEPADRLYRLKGRDPHKPSQLLAADVDALFACVPELDEHAGTIVRALLPGPYTLVLPNPARRFRWLTGENQDAIGVRVADLPAEAKQVVSALGAVVATSANLAGGKDPRRVEDIPPSMLEGVEAVVDAGELPGTPSTVLDFTGAEPRVVREGAVSGDEAIARVREAVG